jgi:aryl-alcohol dehydrogenase
MRGVVFDGTQPQVVDDLEIREPGPGEVLVAVAAAGLCHSDLSVIDGTIPFPVPVVLGHEGAGVVEEVGSAVTRVSPGDRVALSYTSCGSCRTCATGRPYYCGEFFARNFGAARPDGSTALSREGKPVHSHFFGQSSFATGAIVPERSLVRLPDDVPFEVVAPFGCGVQTGAGAVLNVLRPQAGSAIAVFGAGGVGLSAIMAAAVVGCATIVAVDVNPSRLELALELGATHAVNAAEDDPVQTIRELTGGGADYTLEMSGSTVALGQAVESLAPDSTCGVIGAPPFGVAAELDVNGIIAFGRTVRGIVEGHSVPEVFIPQLIELWRAGKLPVERLIETYDFDAINEAAAAAESGDVVKCVLRMA